MRWEIKKIIYLNKFTKWKSKNEIIENFKNLEFSQKFSLELFELTNELC